MLLFFFVRLFWAAENSDTKNRLRFLCKGSDSRMASLTKVLLFFFVRLFWAAENSDTKNRLRFLCKGS